eukprot:COSAG01_NODE_8481_length_2771_cov_1.532186_2_plen_58_part_00
MAWQSREHRARLFRESNIAITSHMDANIQPKVASSWKAKMALALPTSGDATGESTIA